MANSYMWGDWNRLRNIGMENLFEKERVKAGLNKIGEDILEEVKKRIRVGDLKLTPLEKETIRRKNPDQPILINREEWIDKLEVKRVTVNKSGFTLFIGGAKDKAHIGDGESEPVPMDLFTEWIEYGTAKQPPRPAFNLTWEDIKHDIQLQIIDLLGKEMLNSTFNLRFTGRRSV